MSSRISIYYGRDNPFEVLLTHLDTGEKLTAAEMATITKYELKYKGTYYNSIAYPAAFSADGATAIITIIPSTLELPIGSDLTEFIIYSATYPNGFVCNVFQLAVLKTATLAVEV